MSNTVFIAIAACGKSVDHISGMIEQNFKSRHDFAAAMAAAGEAPGFRA
jgi:hypothetical protein